MKPVKTGASVYFFSLQKGKARWILSQVVEGRKGDFFALVVLRNKLETFIWFYDIINLISGHCQFNKDVPGFFAFHVKKHGLF